jgi:hypothetical protein
MYSNTDFGQAALSSLLLDIATWGEVWSKSSTSLFTKDCYEQGQRIFIIANMFYNKYDTNEDLNEFSNKTPIEILDIILDKNMSYWGIFNKNETLCWSILLLGEKEELFFHPINGVRDYELLFAPYSRGRANFSLRKLIADTGDSFIGRELSPRMQLTNYYCYCRSKYPLIKPALPVKPALPGRIKLFWTDY